MKASEIMDAQKAFILKEGANGHPFAKICRIAGIGVSPFYDPSVGRVSPALLCPHSLDHLRLEFSASSAGDGLDAPPKLCS